MAEQYDDSIGSFKFKEDKKALPKPHVKIIVDGQSIFMPGMKTYFVDDDQKSGVIGHVDKKTASNKGKKVVGGTYCSCNTVLVSSRRIDTYGSSGPSGSGSSYGGSTCSCDTVNPCPGNCGCVSYTSSGSGGGGSVSCGSPCACVPVH